MSVVNEEESGLGEVLIRLRLNLSGLDTSAAVRRKVNRRPVDCVHVGASLGRFSLAGNQRIAIR